MPSFILKTQMEILQENRLLEEEILVFYTQNECLFVLLEQSKHMAARATGGKQAAPVAL